MTKRQMTRFYSIYPYCNHTVHTVEKKLRSIKLYLHSMSSSPSSSSPMPAGPNSESFLMVPRSPHGSSAFLVASLQLQILMSTFCGFGQECPCISFTKNSTS